MCAEKLLQLPSTEKYYSMYLKKGRPCINEYQSSLQFIDQRFPDFRQLERLDWKVVGEPLLEFIHGIHGDEDLGNSWEKFIPNAGINNYLIVSNANPLALAIGKRGFIRPLTKKEKLQKKQGIVTINGKEGKLIDLNRAFCKLNDQVPLEEIRNSLLDNQARLLLELALKYPSTDIINLHGDPQFGHFDEGIGNFDPQLGQRDGFYIYYNHNEPDKRILEILRESLSSLLGYNFHLAEGVIDKDPIVGNIKADNGLILQPAVRKDGTRPEDPTLEGLLLRLGELGLTQTKSVLTIEVPMGLSPARKDLLMEILALTLFKPLYDLKRSKNK